jgi:hypothetical protein
MTGEEKTMTYIIGGDRIIARQAQTLPDGRLNWIKREQGVRLLGERLGKECRYVTGEPMEAVLDADGRVLGFEYEPEKAAWPSVIEASPAETVTLLDCGIAAQQRMPSSDGLVVAYLSEKNVALLEQVANPSRVVPIVTMDALRHLGAVVSKRISWEKTLIDFAQEYQFGSIGSWLGRFPRFLVLLESEGMLVLDDGNLTFLYLPSKLEGDNRSRRISGTVLNGEKEAVLAAVLTSLDADGNGREQNGEGAFALEPLLRFIDGGGREEAVALRIGQWRQKLRNRRWTLLHEYYGDSDADKLAVAKRIVREGDHVLLRHVPACVFGNLKTVDRTEIEFYRGVVNLFNEYLAGKEARPLNLAVFGFPGSGKSFGIKQIAKSQNVFKDFTFNLSQFTSLRELEIAFQVVRDTAIKGEHVPLVFFDEFDSAFQGERLGWLKYFLAPMQDGTFLDQGTERPIGRAVFVFAGGTSVSFEQFVGQDEAFFRSVKGPDFVSRLKGYINIQGPNPSTDRDEWYVIRRAMLLRSMIERNARHLLDENKIARIEENLLHALLTTKTYRHGARSMEFLLAMSQLKDASVWQASLLPHENQMDIHVDMGDFRQQLSILSVIDTLAKASHQAYVEEVRARNPQAQGEALVPWEQLPETYRKSNYEQVAYHCLRFRRYGIGIRPIDDRRTRPFVYRKDDLEALAREEHQRWMRERERDGWRYGEVRDNAAKTHPNMVEWERLGEEDRQKDRDALLRLPELLNRIGLELYYEEA